jgi:hypothetical protein
MPLPVRVISVKPKEFAATLDLGMSGFSPSVIWSPLDHAVIGVAGSVTTYPDRKKELTFIEQGHLYGGGFFGLYSDLDKKQNWRTSLIAGAGLANSEVAGGGPSSEAWAHVLGHPLTSADTLPLDSGPTRRLASDYKHYFAEIALNYRRDYVTFCIASNLAKLHFDRYTERWYDMQPDTLFPFEQVDRTGNMLLLTNTFTIFGSDERSPLFASLQLSWTNKLKIDNALDLTFWPLSIHFGISYIFRRRDRS